MSKWKNTLLIVSHDQSFLDNICTDIIHLNNKKLDYYRGNYTKFSRMFENKQKDQMKQYEKQAKQLKQQKDKGISSKNAKNNIIKEQNRKKNTTNNELIEKPKDYIVKFRFPPPYEISPPVLGLFDATFAYPKCENIFENVNFGVDLDTRSIYLRRKIIFFSHSCWCKWCWQIHFLENACWSS